MDVLDLPDYSALADESQAPFASTSSLKVSTSTAGLEPSSASSSRSDSPSLSAAASPSAGPARTNPLTDLIATEKLYVDDLASVIKRVAAAWSRTNFPPPHLDAMFRAIEAVYRINKALLGRLSDIGPSPSSPKLLGDLLMRWIDELEPAYRRYASALTCSFDDDAAVQANPKLASILASLPRISSSRPGTPQPEDDGSVTIDKLFILPFYRLRYYKKLYAKLLKSTQPGRSDHRLLIGANEKLDALLALCDESVAARRDELAALPLTERAPSAERMDRPSPLDGYTESPRPMSAERGPSPALESTRVKSTASSSSYGRGDIAASGSQTTLGSAGTTASLATAAGGSSPMPVVANVDELERRLDTARTLDIFTMKPKKCKLQMQPPQLTYSRSMRQSGEVALRFTPASDANAREVHIQRAHLFLLTDLFLVCEPVASSERGEASPGADFWLLFPPLSGKHLRVERDDTDELAFDIVIMRKERLTVRCESRAAVLTWMESFEACTAFGNSALRVKTTESSGSRSPTAHSPVPMTPSGLQYPLSPAGSTFSGVSDRLNPRTFSTASDPVGSRPRSAEPDYIPPPPRIPSSSSNGYGPHHDSMPPLRRASAGAATGQPAFRSSSSAAQYPPLPQGPPAGAYRPPPPPGISASDYDRSRQPPPPPPPHDAPYGRGPPDLRPLPSSRSVASSMSRRTDPGYGRLDVNGVGMHRSRSADGLRSAPGTNGDRHYRAPSTVSPVGPPIDPDDDFGPDDDMPEMPTSTGPVKSQIAAQMRCKVFLQQGRMQWKAVGTAKLRLYLQSPTNVKQLVVEQGDGGKAKPIISTIVLTDGVERVGKTGVAIELSDKGERTGIVYMLQMKTEQAATGLFQQLLLGSDRTSVAVR